MFFPQSNNASIKRIIYLSNCDSHSTIHTTLIFTQLEITHSINLSLSLFLSIIINNNIEYSYMTQMMWPLSSPKNTTTTTMKMQNESATSTSTTTTTTTVATKSMVSTCYCCCLVTKLMRKLKRRGRTLRPKIASRQGSFQCRYDPLSYSLNFDSTGCGSLMDEDYYKFYAFSSRFVSNPRTSSCPVLQVPSGNSH